MKQKSEYSLKLRIAAAWLLPFSAIARKRVPTNFHSSFPHSLVSVGTSQCCEQCSGGFEGGEGCCFSETLASHCNQGQQIVTNILDDGDNRYEEENAAYDGDDDGDGDDEVSGAVKFQGQAVDICILLLHLDTLLSF